MMQCAERIFVMGHNSPIGVALVRQLERMGHPRTHIAVPMPAEPVWVDQASIRACLEEERPDLVYVIDSVCGELVEQTDPTQNSSKLPACAMIGAASDAGIARLMYVATGPIQPLAAHQRPEGYDLPSSEPGEPRTSRETDALKLCGELSARGLDYRSVLTCEPYGPFWPRRTPVRMGRAACLIDGFLHEFSNAVATGHELVTIMQRPDDRLEMMFVNDIADAIVHVMDLPRCALTDVAPSPFMHIDIGADGDVSVMDLAMAAAAAAGFRGRVLFETEASLHPARRIGNGTLARLGWRPLIELDTGMELTAMDYRLRHMARHVQEKQENDLSTQTAVST